MDAINNKISNSPSTVTGQYAADESNQVTSEILKTITASGATPTGTNNHQLMQSMDRFTTGFGNWCNDTNPGTGSYTLVHQDTSFTRLPPFTGLTLKFRPTSANSLASPALTYLGVTYNLLGEVDALIAGDISGDRDCEIRFNGSTFIVLERSISRLTANLYPKGYINGFELSWRDASSINIAPGECQTTDSGSGVRLNADQVATIWKSTATWSIAGSGGGFPSNVTPTANTWYRVFILSGPVGNTAGFDTSTVASNLRTTAGAANYTHYRQIGWMRIDNDLAIREFQISASDPNHVVWNETAFEAGSYANLNPTGRHAIATVDAPPGSDAYLTGFFYYSSGNNGATWWLLLSSGNSTATEPSNGNYTYTSASAQINVLGFDGRFTDKKITLDGSGIYYFSQRNTGTLNLAQYNAFVTGYSWKR